MRHLTLSFRDSPRGRVIALLISHFTFNHSLILACSSFLLTLLLIRHVFRLVLHHLLVVFAETRLKGECSFVLDTFAGDLGPASSTQQQQHQSRQRQQ